MREKLYPPQIEGTLPAYCLGTTLSIPFVMNKTVGWNEIVGFSLKIKNISNNYLVVNLNTYSYDRENCIAFFSNVGNALTKGSSYKVQLAYLYREINSDVDLYGYYSTVGVIKCTETPVVSIVGLEGSQLHSDTRTYLGKYSQVGRDVTEKIYSYNFTVYDESNKILETSGELLHNHENDDQIDQSEDAYTMIKALEENKIYTIVYTTTSANGVVTSSPRYRITQQSTVAPELSAKLVAIMNEENGYVNLQLVGDKDEFGVEKVGTGKFLICRSSSEDNFGSWSEVDRFVLYGEAPSSHNWKDFTVQHGFTYVYSLQQYNDYQIYSNRMLSNEIVANFEHSFLYDGKRQLKIKFNPKVTSFKETLLEQKTNTLGGKYPFFFRNANVAYKEFPISGLVSYHSDEEQLFLTNNDLQLEDLSNLKREHSLLDNIKSNDYDYFNSMLDANMAYKLQTEYNRREQNNSQEKRIADKRDRTTNLTDYNIVAERIFKMKVLEFLNDGQPKLFRSPGEGNYIVRLMNSSLSPDDKLNRMIHTFSTTATEIDTFNYQKLGEYKLIQNSEPIVKQLRWKTIDVRELINNTPTELRSNFISIGDNNNIMSVQFLDMTPGDQIEIQFAAPDAEIRNIQIGMTGAYYIEFDKPAHSVNISKNCIKGQVTYSYYGNTLHHFDTYKAIKMDDIPIIQLIGPSNGKDIREAYDLEDIKHVVTKYYFLNFTKDYNSNINMNKELEELKEQYHNKEIKFNEYEEKKQEIYQKYNDTKSLFKIWIDGKEIDIAETNDYQLIKPDHIPEIKLGVGVCLDASIQRREIEYGVEDTNSAVITAKQSYIEVYNDIQNLIKYICIDKQQENKEINTNESRGEEPLDTFLQKTYKVNNIDVIRYEILPMENYKEQLSNRDANYKNAYNNFINTLTQALAEKEA